MIRFQTRRRRPLARFLVFALALCGRPVLAVGAPQLWGLPPALSAASGDSGYESLDATLIPLVVETPDVGVGSGPVSGTDLARLFGADRFHAAGLTGRSAVVATIGAGHTWTGHETLGHVVLIPQHAQALGEFNRRDTWSAMVIGGRPSTAHSGSYQSGLAPDVDLYSGAIASQWNGQRLASDFWFWWESVSAAYKRASLGALTPEGRPADVVNSGWVSHDSSSVGDDFAATTVDAMAVTAPRTLQVSAVRRRFEDSPTVQGPATGFNQLRVAPLKAAGGYRSPADTAAPSLGDFWDWGTEQHLIGVRTLVDLAAPGEALTAAYYGDETGGNGVTDGLTHGGFPASLWSARWTCRRPRLLSAGDRLGNSAGRVRLRRGSLALRRCPGPTVRRAGRQRLASHQGSAA